MKNFIYVIAILFSVRGFAQDADSLVVMSKIDSLIETSLNYVDQGEFDKAFEINQNAEEYATENFGGESGAYGKTCFNHGRILFYKGEYNEAEKWYLKAQTIQEKAFGKDHFDYGMTLNNLAINYYVMGDYNKSESFFLDALSIFEKVVGKEDPQYAITLNNLAYLYTEMGRYDQSEASYLKALSIFEKARGKENATCAAILNNLGIVNRLKGDYKKSEPFFLESKDIRGRVLGKEHTNYAGSLNNLGLLYWQMGKYVEAESLYLESNAIWEKLLGKEHPDYIGSLTNLGIFYQYMGNHKKAEPLYVEANNLREKVLGKEHPDYAWSLGNLGQFYSTQGEYEKAEPLLLEAKKIRKKVLDPEHPDYAASLMNLGSLYYVMGRYTEAETLFLESQTIQEKTLGKEHPSYADNWYNLGDLYLVTKQYDKAKKCFSEAISIQEKVLGKEHPDFVKSLNGQVVLDWKLKDYGKVLPSLNEIAISNKSLLINAVQHLTEKELEQYILEFSNAQSLTLSFGQLGSENSMSIAGVCFDNCLFYKGFILNYSSQISQIAGTHGGQAENINQLSVYRRVLSAEYSKPLNERQGVADLEEKANTFEKELVRTVTGYGEAIRQVNWQEVQQTLPINTAAIEFVHYKFFDPDPTDSIMYAALIMQAGQESPLFIPLFEEKSLDSLVNLHSSRRSDYVNDLYALDERGATAIGIPQKTLYEMIWQPLEKELEGVEKIYYSPSGLLHRLNLGAIPMDRKITLADRYELTQLGSTRQVVFQNEKEELTGDALLFGGIQYEADTAAMLAANASILDDELAARSHEASTRGALDFNVTDTLLRGGQWRYLNGTDVEVAVIQQIMKQAKMPAEVKKGFTATEEAFKSIGKYKPSPKVLHLATHGYFFPDPKSVGSSQSGGGSQEVVFKMSEHPMIRSGLILAGGNHAWKEGQPLLPGMEDGILTAYEISQMDLSNTELVVLSACETGLGDIQGNEGVYGLQRAFKIAGAKYLIMSLWQVPDYQTQELMTSFYEKWLDGKMGIPEAFRSAQQEMRLRYRNPYFWAGFVLVE